MVLTTADYDQKSHKAAQNSAISRLLLDTLQDLLNAVRRREPEQTHLLSMLGATVAHISLVLGQPAGRIAIHQLLEISPELQRHLRERGFRRNTVRSYTNFVRILLDRARSLGWSEVDPAVENAWAGLRRVLSKKIGCSGIVRYAVHNGKTPAEFGESDLTKWREIAIRAGRSFEYITSVKGRFKKAVYDAGFASALPHLVFSTHDEKFYGLPVSRFPEPLRSQVLELLRWKTAPFASGRPRRAKLRPVSAEHLRWVLSRLAGFIVRIKGGTLTNLGELLSRQVITEFAEWSLNQRRVKGRSVHNELGRICGLRCYPPLASHDFSWLPELMAQLPLEDRSQVTERKRPRWVTFDELARIPERIRQEATVYNGLSERRRAEMVRDALLMRWLTTLPWRQRNLRECGLGPFSEGGNLWQEEVLPQMGKPPEVEEALKANSHAKFWQFCFRPDQTKTGRAVRGILPQRLVAPLEEYILGYRRILLGDQADPGTLFLGYWGRPLTSHDVGRIIGGITQKYAGRRVNPHLFRDIYATQWLEERPESYYRLSKILWHADQKTTTLIYGAGYDESHGAVSAEEWLDTRRKR
jgi:integrase